MPVPQMLRKLTAKELTEWRAYEKKNGPLDDTWRDHALASLIDLVQGLLYLTSQAHFGQDSKGRPVKGPIDAPKDQYVRPWHMHYPPEEPSKEDAAAKNAEQIRKLDAALENRKEKNAKAK